jgi:hypothetical protein
MKVSIIFTAVFLMAMTIIGCKKDAPIRPDQLEAEYKLPQGDHPYDRTILDFYQKYGTFFLYKFNSKDFRWNITANIPYTADQADEAYVAPALEMLDKKLFSFYSEDLLKQVLPYKIILSSRIREIKTAYNGGLDTLERPVNSASSTSHFAFGMVSARLGQLNAAELKVMKGDLHQGFWMQAIYGGKLQVPPLFASSTDYSMVGEFSRKNYGVFVVRDNMTFKEDMGDYINAITSHSYQELEAQVFNTENDPRGRFFYKYKVIVNFYKAEYKIDLQAIGNAVN